MSETVPGEAPESRRAKPGRRLYVLIHGLKYKPEPWANIESWVKENDPGAGVFLARRKSHAFSIGVTPLDEAQRLCNAIEEESSGFDEVVLIGHSSGALIMRSAFLVPFQDRFQIEYSWHKKVKRIIMLAGVSQGVHPNRDIRLRLIFWLLNTFRLEKTFLNAHFLRGSDYLADLRLDWMSYARQNEQTWPDVVQLLGGDDHLVVTEDNVDVAQFPGAKQHNVAGATHSTIIDVKIPSVERTFRKAIFEDIPRQPYQPQNPPQVVLCVHGIHATSGGWAKQYVENFEDSHVIAQAPSLRWLGPLEFLSPGQRRTRVNQFINEYCNLRAKYPTADFHVVAHSNGSYTVFRAMERISAMRFKRICFAGTPLPQHANFLALKTRQQYESVQNHRSNKDLTIGVLAYLASQVQKKDLGSAGYYGFETATAPDLEEVHYYDGGHDRPFAADNFENIAAYILRGDEDRRSTPVVTPTDVPLGMRYGARLARAALAFGILFGLASLIAVLGLTLPPIALWVFGGVSAFTILLP